MSERTEAGSKDLINKRILVTGGASGIGEACCRMLFNAGAFVVIADRDVTAGRELEASLKASGIEQDKVKFLHVDVGSWASQIRLFAQALEILPGGELDILITSAGVGGSQQWQINPASPAALTQSTNPPAMPSTQCLDIGLLGTMYSAHIAIKYAFGLHNGLSNPHGESTKSLILVGSSAGYRHVPGLPDYTVLKWGVRGLFRSLRHELSAFGVRVNMLAPTFVATPMIAHRLAALKEKGLQMATMENVLQAVKALVTDDTMTGRALCIAGNGVEDMCDDLDGFDGGEMHRKLVNTGDLPPLPLPARHRL